MKAQRILAACSACRGCEAYERGQLNATFQRACPLGKWTREPGLGDRVAALAQPIARVIDATLGTDLANCGGCAQMHADLNAGLSFPKCLRRRLKR